MAARTPYQKQADTRTKKALKLRASFDNKVRKYTLALLAALDGAQQARARINRLNTLYGVDISTETLLVHELRAADLGPQLTATLAASSPGEEVQLFNATMNGNAGEVLALEAVFGEIVSATSTTPVPPTAPTFSNKLIGANDSAAGVTLAAQAGDDFSFNALSTGGSAPMSMDLYYNGQQVASVAYLDRYNGKPFLFGGPLGTFSGTFASGGVNL